MDVAIKVLYGILPENQPYIKDIYDKLEDAQEQHPHDLIAVGYCIADPRTGYVIDEDYEWRCHVGLSRTQQIMEATTCRKPRKHCPTSM